jgi:hypothetical protein
MFLAEDLGIDIFYQDTDSLHMFEDDLKRLADAFTEKYGRTLVGENLGQFHSDFEFSCKDCGKKASGVVSEVFVGCGKKCYIDVLTGTCRTKECVSENKRIRDEHIRLKGVPKDAVLAYCIEKGQSPEQVFRELYDGKSILFDCSANNKCRFEKGKNMVFTTANKILRAICFDAEERERVKIDRLNEKRLAEGKTPFVLKQKTPKPKTDSSELDDDGLPNRGKDCAF